MRGLRARLVMTFALVAALTAAALAVTSYALVRDAVLDRATEAAVRDARTALNDLVNAPPPASLEEARVRLTELADAGDADVVAVARDGTYESTSVSLSAASVPPQLAEAAADGRLVSLRTGSGRGDYVVAGGTLPDGPSLFLFFSLSDEVADLELLRNVLAGAGSGFVLLSALVGVLAARGLLRPLRRARLAAHRMAVGLLGTRLPEEGRDEFTELARAFNQMADALERTVGELRTLEASHRRFVSDVSHELRTPLTALNRHRTRRPARAGRGSGHGRRGDHDRDRWRSGHPSRPPGQRLRPVLQGRPLPLAGRG
ncbi:MAG: HAMP domain-containing protein [Actinobacteria bacterium]|nr:HAMP domain-containing protein [Actinomycetota bacterium]